MTSAAAELELVARPVLPGLLLSGGAFNGRALHAEAKPWSTVCVFARTSSVATMRKSLRTEIANQARLPNRARV